MTPIIFHGRSEPLARWIADRIGESGLWGNYYLFAGIDDRDEPGVVVLINDVQHKNACIHVAKREDYIIPRPMFFYVFDYIFNTCRANRATGLVRENNESALRFDQKLGFKEEGRLPRFYEDGSSLIMLGMYREDCKWVHSTFRDRVLRRPHRLVAIPSTPVI